MFKLLGFFAMLVIAVSASPVAEPQVLAYSAPALSTAYGAPLAYGAYGAPVVSSYGALPLGYSGYYVR